MRKCFVSTMLLFLILITSLVYVHIHLNDTKDDVIITEETIYGDVSAAEGLYVNISTQSNDHLYWDTGFYLTGEPIPNVDFEFTTSARNQNIEYPGNEGIYLEAGTQIYNTNGTTGSAGYNIPDFLRETFMELVDSIDDYDETKTAIVNFSDYYEYYPVNMWFFSPMYFESAADKSKAIEAFKEYFKIPVREETPVKLSVTKQFSVYANNYQFEISFLNETIRSSYLSVIADSGCYFIFTVYSDYGDYSGEMMDMSQIPGGFGLYFFPCRNTDAGFEPLYEELNTVITLDPEKTEKIIDLSITPDKKNLLLLTFEESEYVLYVLDADTAQLNDRIELYEFADVSGYTRPLGCCYAYNDWVVYIFEDGTIGLLTKENGRFNLKFTLDALDYVDFNLNYMTSWGTGEWIDWDGTRLAIVSASGIYDIYVAIFDETGLLYAGKIGQGQENENVTFRPVFENTLSISWERK